MVQRLRSLALFVKAFLKRDKLEARLQEELETHIDLLAEKNMRQGMPPEEARRQARIALGAFAQVREECRDARRFGLIEDFGRDLRYALHQVRRAPGFALMAIVTLALGIGATTAVFSLVSATLLPVLPYRDPGRLVEISISNPRQLDAGPILINDFEYTSWKQSTRSCERIGAFFEDDCTLAGGGAAEFPVPVHVALVSEDFFPTLGVAPAIGRAFQPGDYPRSLVRLSGLPVAQRQFGPDESKTSLVKLDSSHYQVRILRHDVVARGAREGRADRRPLAAVAFVPKEDHPIAVALEDRTRSVA